jgi:hypothetical protein
MLMVGIKHGSYSMTTNGVSFIHISTDISNILEIFRIQEGGDGWADPHMHMGRHEYDAQSLL